jgi:hypothetical protein
MKTARLITVSLGLALATFGLIGCKRPAPQPDTQRRMEEIVKNASGEWDSLSQADREFLIQQANGNELTAQMRFTAMKARLKGAGGPPAPGAMGR